MAAKRVSRKRKKHPCRRRAHQRTSKDRKQIEQEIARLARQMSLLIDELLKQEQYRKKGSIVLFTHGLSPKVFFNGGRSNDG